MFNADTAIRVYISYGKITTSCFSLLCIDKHVQ